MYRLHDALGHRARPSRRAHACRLGITLAGACRAHVATGSRRSFGRRAMELDGGRPRMRYVSKATIGLGVSLGAAAGAAQCHGTAPARYTGSVTSCGRPETARGAARGVSFVYLFSFLVVHTFLKCPECLFLFFNNFMFFLYVSGWLCSPLASGVDSRLVRDPCCPLERKIYATCLRASVPQAGPRVS